VVKERESDEISLFYSSFPLFFPPPFLLYPKKRSPTTFIPAINGTFQSLKVASPFSDLPFPIPSLNAWLKSILDRSLRSSINRFFPLPVVEILFSLSFFFFQNLKHPGLTNEQCRGKDLDCVIHLPFSFPPLTSFLFPRPLNSEEENSPLLLPALSVVLLNSGFFSLSFSLFPSRWLLAAGKANFLVSPLSSPLFFPPSLHSLTRLRRIGAPA